MRFAGDLAKLWPAGERLGLAVSGGADSLALLVLADAARPGGFDVASVDHGLRDDSAGEAAAVARVCAERAIPHATLRLDVPGGANLQARARTARYAALGRWAGERTLGAVATGHHLDDQAETVLMRLLRGAGVRGLAAMRPDAPLPGAPGVRLLRPLLGWRKAELAAVAGAAGLVPADDPSNRDPRHARVAVRAGLAAADWIDPPALAASAAHCAAADAALAWAAVREWGEQVAATGVGLTYLPSAPRAVRLRVLERVVAELGGEGTPRGREIARWLDALESGEVATLGGVRGDGRRPPWRFAAAPPRRR